MSVNPAPKPNLWLGGAFITPSAPPRSGSNPVFKPNLEGCARFSYGCARQRFCLGSLRPGTPKGPAGVVNLSPEECPGEAPFTVSPGTPEGRRGRDPTPRPHRGAARAFVRHRSLLPHGPAIGTSHRPQTQRPSQISAGVRRSAPLRTPFGTTVFGSTKPNSGCSMSLPLGAHESCWLDNCIALASRAGGEQYVTRSMVEAHPYLTWRDFNYWIVELLEYQKDETSTGKCFRCSREVRPARDVHRPARPAASKGKRELVARRVPHRPAGDVA